MKNLVVVALVLLLLGACQKKQYFTASPEIDLVKKANAAYFAGDWDTFKSAYADTAKIWFNKWHSNNPGLTPDQFIETLKGGLANYSEYKVAETPIYDMIINDTGDNWVQCWLLWSAKTKTGTEVNVPVHLSLMVKSNKVVYQALIVDALPGYLASMPSDSSAAKP